MDWRHLAECAVGSIGERPRGFTSRPGSKWQPQPSTLPELHQSFVAATMRCVITAVVFDVGECLVDETREYGTWADWLKVPRHTFSSMFGAVIAQGLDYREVFQVFSPGFDLAQQRAARARAGLAESFDNADLYSDVRQALSELREAGFWVGIAGNQTRRAGQILRSLELSVDMIATSDDLGVEKPDIAFFERVAELARKPPSEILYVGDRLDNDIRPAAQLGMCTALIRRGPWATIQRDMQEAANLPTMRINGLLELTESISRINSAQS